MPRLGRTHTSILYVLALLREFRWSLGILGFFLVIGTVLFYVTPGEFEKAQTPDTVFNAAYATWMTMLVQDVNPVPTTWYLALVCGLYPVVGLIVVGEGVVRLALLLFSKRHGRKEWMRVMASTYKDHTVLCGIGHLGIRVLDQLVAAGVSVVAVERDEDGQFVAQAKRTGAPVIIGDMKDDNTLLTAGINRARTVIIATNDDIANLEVALDSRRLNPDIRVVMRLFEQSIAQKVSNAFLVDVAFSASTLAAPIVAAMSYGAKVLTSSLIANIPHVTAEVTVEAASLLDGERIETIERRHLCKVLARTPAAGPIELPPDAHTILTPGDTLVVHTPSSQLTTLATAASASPVGAT